MHIVITSPSGYRDRYGVDHKQGESCELPDYIAIKLIAHGMADRIPEPEPAPKVETAEAAPAENMAKRTSKPRPRKRS